MAKDLKYGMVVLPCVAHVPHPGAVDHGGLRDFGEDFVLGLSAEHEADAHPLSGLHQGGQPAGADCGGIAIAGDIEIGMKNAVHYDVVTAFGVHRGGGQNIQNGGGAGFQLGKIRFFLPKEEAFQKRLSGGDIIRPGLARLFP